MEICFPAGSRRGDLRYWGECPVLPDDLSGRDKQGLYQDCTIKRVVRECDTFLALFEKRHDSAPDKYCYEYSFFVYGLFPSGNFLWDSWIGKLYH